ncbi:MAG: long-chain-fatty-acid--CoA ligase [Myxococcales bacterium]|nr:long-chain-fatty-acid--CoA ligase [Myxococcales bacterium]
MKELIYPRHLLERASWYSDKVGFIDGEYRATYSQHVDRLARLCAAMRDELGIQKHDRFALMALNGHCFLELYHAAFFGAGIINPLNLRLAPKEVEYILKDSETKVCFVDAFFAGMVAELKEATGIEKIVLIGDGDVPHDVKYEDLIASATPRFPEEPEEEDPAVLMYTGGTTGLPKGVLVDHRAEMLNFFHALAAFHLDEHIVYLHQTPMFHAASMVGVLGAPMGGTSVFIPAFNPAQVLDAIETHKVNLTVMVPIMVQLMMMAPEFKPERLASLERLTYGASPMPKAVLEQLIETFPKLDLYQGYGMTEGSAVLTMLSPEDHRKGGKLLSSAGRALPGVRLSIQDDDGNILPQGETGEVCARGGNFMQEYWKKPEATAEAFRGGWYHSGDAGYIDENGYLFLVDRVKDMIVTGGENVYSVEVENAIASHPAVAQVAVIGIPDDSWGEAVHAIVVPHAGAEVGAEDVIAHARASIAGYKVPKSVEFRSEPMPLSGALKVLKRELRAPYWEGKDRGVN